MAKLICHWCNNEFESRNIMSRYCCATHKKYAQRFRKKCGIRQPAQKGFLYLLDSEIGLYKIGVTTASPYMRVIQIAMELQGVYGRIGVYGMAKSNDIYSLEKEIHDKYGIKKVKGEWFSLSVQDVRDVLQMMAHPTPFAADGLTPSALDNGSARSARR